MNLILLLHKFTPIYTICIRETNKSTIFRNFFREDKDSFKKFKILSDPHVFKYFWKQRGRHVSIHFRAT